MQEFVALDPLLLWCGCRHVSESQPTHHLFPACITYCIASALRPSRRTLTCIHYKFRGYSVSGNQVFMFLFYFLFKCRYTDDNIISEPHVALRMLIPWNRGQF